MSNEAESIKLTTYQDGEYTEWHQNPTEREWELRINLHRLYWKLRDASRKANANFDREYEQAQDALKADFISRRGKDGWEWIQHRFSLYIEAKIESGGPHIEYENQNLSGPEG